MVQASNLHSNPLSQGVAVGGDIHVVVGGIFTTELGLRGSARNLAHKLHIDPSRVRTFYVADRDGDHLLSGARGIDSILETLFRSVSLWLSRGGSPDSDALANEVQSLLETHPNVILHGHSRSALVIDHALDMLPDVQDRLEVITYGGIRAISPEKAGRVTNVVNLQDGVASMGRFCAWNSEGSSGAGAGLQHGEGVDCVEVQQWGADFINHDFEDYISHLRTPHQG
jgi:hypothetical protein